MNGRLYDPVVGRFLSPDPYITDPSFSQSYNRYSYCLNNPLKFTDYSGESWKSFWNKIGDWMTRNNIQFQVGVNISGNGTVPFACISGPNNFNINSQNFVKQPTAGYQIINEQLAGFGSLGLEPLGFGDMPNLELGEMALTLNPQYNTSPERINYEGHPDQIYDGLIGWAEYLNVGPFEARKTKDGRFYHLNEIFYNLPSASQGGFSPMGDVKTEYKRTSNGNIFSMGIPNVEDISRNRILRIRKHESLYAPNRYQLTIFFEGGYNRKGARDNIITFRIKDNYDSIIKRIFGEDYNSY